MRAAVILAGLSLVASIACNEPAPVAQPDAPPPPRPPRPASVISFVNGTVVLDRTAEAGLTSTPLQSLDGNEETVWSAPPGDPTQSMTLELPVRTRIRALGLVSGRPSSWASVLKTAVFEASDDGVTFTPLGGVTVTDRQEEVIVDVTPRETRFVRITMAESMTAGNTRVAPAIEAYGEELESFEPRTLEGSWMIDALPARFSQKGGRVEGSVETVSGPPIRLDGGWEGRHVRFIWTRGPEYGYATITLSRDGRHLSGIAFFEEVIALFTRASWYGMRGNSPFVPIERPEPVSEGTALIGRSLPARPPIPASYPDEPVTAAFLRRFGKVALYQITFSGDAVDAAASAEGFALLESLLKAAPEKSFALTVYELREPTPDANQERSERRARSLAAALAARGIDLARLEIRAAGSNDPVKESRFPLQRLMYSRIELSEAPRR